MERIELMDIIIKALERLETKVDKIDERVDSVDKTLVKQEVSLAEHIRRTHLLEQQMVPVVKHVGVVSFVGKMMLIFLSSGIVWELVKLALIK